MTSQWVYDEHGLKNAAAVIPPFNAAAPAKKP